jgi:hypothetical protein
LGDGAGGGGILSAGTDGFWVAYGSGGQAAIDGGAGGQSGFTGGPGGFGGGAGASSREGAGGGGYSGGGGARRPDISAEGGTSFIATGALITVQTPGGNPNADGRVLIEWAR